MKNQIPEKLKSTAQAFDSPLYIVGGYVRNALLGIGSTDIDVASSCDTQTAIEILKEQGWEIKSCYKRLGTIKFFDPKTKTEVEYTQFRTESYLIGGTHTPENVEFTTDIVADAKRRDFRINAIYCNAKTGEIVDPLKGIGDLEKKLVSAADSPQKVFSSDGLRLLRLVRFSAELGFEIEEKTFQAAYEYRNNIDDIAWERIADELTKICYADQRYPLLTKGNSEPPHYRGIIMLDRLGLLEKILPEITAGKGMVQRADFHRYDVFRHALETFKVSSPSVRIAALLHDIGKPIRFKEDGRFYGHADVGAERAFEIATNTFQKNKREAKEISDLVRFHMLDVDGLLKENKLKLFLARNIGIVEKLLELKQADFIGCGLLSGECPTVTKWKKVLETMKEKGTPTSLKDLKINGNDIKTLLPELPKERISEVLNSIFEECVRDESLNDREKLLCRLRNQKTAE